MSKIQEFHFSLSERILEVKNNRSNSKVLGELGRFLFRISTETHLFEYSHRIPLVNKNCYLRKAFNEEPASKESGQLTKVTLWWALTMYLTSSIFEVLKDEIDKNKNIKTGISFSKKELRTVLSQTCLTIVIVMKRKSSFHKQRNSLKRKRPVTKIRLSSYNSAINTIKWYNSEGDKEICKNCERKEIKNEIHMIFSCDNYNNIRRKAFNGINGVNNIKLQIGNNKGS